MKRTALIVAGGKGLRMGSDLPKQFIPIDGRPVLMRTIEAFHRFDAAMQIIVVLPASQQSYWQELCRQYHFCIPFAVANGGDTRFHSVSNGLQLVSSTDGVVAVHDGVRPFVSQEVIARCFSLAETAGAVVPVVDLVDSLRSITPQGSTSVDRKDYKLVQTPQVFQVALLKDAYSKPYRSDFTDDASVVEAAGIRITLTEGNRENIKITTPFDLVVSRALVKCSI